MYTLSQIAEITGTRVVGKHDYTIDHFFNDSRNFIIAKGALFIALKTDRNNGHLYISQLIERGIKCFLISQSEIDLSLYADSDISFVLSSNPLLTIQTLAAYHRQQFNIPVIGITGSNGKTMVKEWLYQLLKDKYSICRSPKSYNSQIGVPLSVLNLNKTHTLAIFEAGISQPNEMDKLASIIRPTIGILTSIGSAHDEGFKNRNDKLSEKLKLLQGSNYLILNGILKKEVDEFLLKKACVISKNPEADIQIQFEGNCINLKSKKKNNTIATSFTDEASLSNVATCIALLWHLQCSEDEIIAGVKNLNVLALRLETKTGIENSVLINDYYNSDLDSLKIALNYLQQQSSASKKLVIISDIEQSGMSSHVLYNQVSELLLHARIDKLIGIGKEISANKHFFNVHSLFFDSTSQFIAQFNLLRTHFTNSIILLKGARSFGFENISRLLQLKSHDTVFEISLNKLTDNVNYFRSLLNKDVKVMGMVKAMAYGSGSVEIARKLQHIGLNYLAVAYSDEGVELRQSQISLPIMVMSPEKEAFEDIILYNLEPELYSFKVFKEFVSKLDNMGITDIFPVHLKLDTGMRRLGFEEKDLEELISLLHSTPQVKIASVFSHLAASDDEYSDNFTNDQIQRFEKMSLKLEKAIGYKVIKHICNSGAISRFKSAQFNMVRLGIGMYGIGVNDSEQNKLQNVGILKTRISQIKEVRMNESIGYSRKGKLKDDGKIATIPIGYADGFSRLLGNGNHGVYVHGNFCKIVGNVCMDMCMIDVTNIQCNEGDEVIIFESTQQINDLAKALHTIPYEVLTNVSARIKRVYVQE